jgi:hypothetical protein
MFPKRSYRSFLGRKYAINGIKCQEIDLSLDILFHR